MDGGRAGERGGRGGRRRGEGRERGGGGAGEVPLYASGGCLGPCFLSGLKNDSQFPLAFETRCFSPYGMLVMQYVHAYSVPVFQNFEDGSSFPFFVLVFFP